MAFGNVSDVFNGAGQIIAPHELPRHVSAAVKELKRTEITGGVDEETGQPKVLGYTTEVKMHDKVASLRLLGMHFGVFNDQVELTLGKDFAAALEAGSQRATVAEKERLAPRTIEGERLS
jgi:hypothetical protein